ncbi:MAG: DUF4124 domain-containing protein [Nitrosomonadales bacterium]|nr:DUF4124 domain-containing protein [Nitrosomonadales bacterium]
MKPRLQFALLCVAYIGCAQAEIYKYVDADGHVTYSSTPRNGAKKLNLEPLPVMAPPARARNKASPADFPKVDGNMQKSRDSMRRKILGAEMTAEEKLLAEARQSLKNSEASPGMYRSKDGNVQRDAAKYEETIKTQRNEVMLHEKNIDALKSELANLK